jgi:hypothetical protein
MDHSIRRIEPASVRPTAPRRRRGGDESRPFDLARDEPAAGAGDEAAAPADPGGAPSDRTVAPRGDDDPGARIDLSA